MTAPAVSRTSLREQVRDWILQRIGSGEFSPGERLREERLATELKVSPIPVREAIRELVATGVLESSPHKGAWVREVETSETIEALQVRAAIESLALKLAGPRLKERAPEFRKTAESIVNAARKRNFTAFQKHNQQFHRSLMAAANSRVLLRVWDSLSYEVGARSVIRHIPSADPVEIAREHIAVVEAIEAGDVDRAGSLLAVHTLRLADYLQSQK